MGLSGCSSVNDALSDDAVAATVNGEEIYEQTITDYIANVREQMGLTDDDDWASWMVSYDYTAETLRSDVIDSYVSRALISQGAEELGITVDDSEIDEQVDAMKQYYDSDEAWEEALEAVGMDEEYYRSEIEQQLKATKLRDYFASDEEPSEEDMIAQCQVYASTYDGARKSSQILFDADDKETAQEVLDKINSGELDFADAAAEYSIDSATAEDGGNVGWDSMNSYIDEYSTALDELAEGEVSDLVESDYGWHIIKCTEIYTAPDEVTSTDQVPEEWLTEIKESLQYQAQTEAYNEWYEQYEEDADIVINDMPEGLPYDVDLSAYQTDGDDEGTTEDDTTVDSTDSDSASVDGDATDETTGDSADSTTEDGDSESEQPAEAA
jgi:foldase protein PrsA